MQSLAAHLHEAQPCAGFSFLKRTNHRSHRYSAMSWLGLVLGDNALEKSQRRCWQDEGGALSFRSYGPGRYLAADDGIEPTN